MLEMVERNPGKVENGVWRQLYGNFASMSVSLEWNEFTVDEDLDWAKSFHEGSLEICLNVSGRAVFRSSGRQEHLSAEQVAVYTTTPSPPCSVRLTGGIHRFFCLEFAPDYLAQEFRFVMDGLLPEVRTFCDEAKATTPMLRVGAMPGQLLGLRMQLLDPPVSPAAYSIWYQSKITEVLSHFLFQPQAPAELFCERHHRINRERCERVVHLLRRDMENPPSLQMLADEVGCSPFYLSRIFAQELGISIPKALRKMRIEKAAELLRAGGISVTDVAMQIGYSSLGAFNKAFLEQMKSTPSHYAKQRPG